MAGKGSKPRNCFSKDFRNNYDDIKWEAKKPKNIVVKELTIKNTEIQTK